MEMTPVESPVSALGDSSAHAKLGNASILWRTARLLVCQIAMHG